MHSVAVGQLSASSRLNIVMVLSLFDLKVIQLHAGF